MPPLSREQILAAALPVETVSIPALGGDVLVRGMTGAENDAFLASLWVGEGADRRQNLSNYRARFLVRCIVDEKGERLFEDDEATRLGQIGAGPIEKLYQVAERLSGMEPNAVENLAKN